MKKLALALVCLVSVAFFASCTQEGEPTIQVLNEEGYVQNGDVVNVNTDFNFGFVMASSAVTGKELTSLIIKIDDQDPDTITISGTEYTYRGTLRYEFRRDEIVGESTITAIVIDAAGKIATANITLSINNPAQPLVPTEFTWNRHGGNDATGLDEFGLEWNSNAKEIYAVITPKEGALLYRFDPSVWATTTTDVEKAALFSEGITTTQFKEISCTAVDKDYDFVIGTAYNGEFHLIHVTHSHVFTFKGTDVTITGEAK
jgi:hypothetical protein